MMLSEKLIALRKGRGWSQEDLADQLDVSRQSVSKWESGASTPDLDKVIRLSEIYGVTTDYLLKDEPMADAAPQPVAADIPETRAVDETEAHAFMTITAEEAPRFARAVMTCVLSPIPLLALMALCELKPNLPEDALAGVGIGVLLLMVAAAVRTFIRGGMRLDPYEYLEKEPLSISPMLKAEVQTLMDAQQPEFTSGLTRGVALCIVSPIPLLLNVASHDGVLLLCVCLLLALVAVATRIFVRNGMVRDSYSKLLQLGDYTPEAKRRAPLAAIYWCIAIAIFFAASFSTGDWEKTWIIWPVAGVLFGAFCALVQLFGRHKPR